MLTALLLLQSEVRLSTAIQIGADEGFELAKATLCLKGYRLYTDVWNDQPPLHTFIITQVLKHISRSILGPRLITTAFTILLLSSVFFMSLRVSGLLVAALTTALLIMSPGFLELASSCMLEIPALALAVAAMCLLLGGRGSVADANGSAGARPPSGAASPDHKEAFDSTWTAQGSDVSAPGGGRAPGGNWRARELLAGALFGAALMTKLVDIYLLPLAVVVLWSRLREGPTNGSSRRKEAQLSAECGVRSAELGRRCSPMARSLLIFLASCGITLVAIDFLIEHGAYLMHFRQSWASHFGPTKTLAYGSASDHPFDWGVLLRNWDTTIPAAVGVSVLLSRFRRERAVPLPLAWLALSLLVFTIHKPWWAYYYVHTAIPMCWCAAGGFAWAIERARVLPSPLPKRRGIKGEGSISSFIETSKRSKGPLIPAFSTLEGEKKIRSSVPIHLAQIAILAVFGVSAASWSGARVYLQAREIRNSPQTYYALVLKEIEQFKPWTDWMYADQQIYSFHTGIPIPPDLAVLVLKRFWAGEMDNDRITQELRQFKPGVILLANDARAVPFKDLLGDEYQVIYQDGAHRLYALKATLKARRNKTGSDGVERD